MRRYKRTAGDADEQAWMTRMWDLEHQRTETLGTQWAEQVSAVRAPSGAQRNRQLQTANNAPQAYTEQRKSVHTLQGAMKRRAWLSAGPTGRMPDFPVPSHSPRDEGSLHSSQPSCHSFVVGVDLEGEET